MFIDCYLDFEGCSEQALRENIMRALEAENAKADVTFEKVPDEFVLSEGLIGLPCVRINGHEVDGGPEGPSVETLRAAIRDERNGGKIRRRQPGRETDTWPVVYWNCDTPEDLL